MLVAQRAPRAGLARRRVLSRLGRGLASGLSLRRDGLGQDPIFELNVGRDSKLLLHG